MIEELFVKPSTYEILRDKEKYPKWNSERQVVLALYSMVHSTTAKATAATARATDTCWTLGTKAELVPFAGAEAAAEADLVKEDEKVT